MPRINLSLLLTLIAASLAAGERPNEAAPASRPQRGMRLFPACSPGANTGPGALPFPDTPLTIIPRDSAPSVTRVAKSSGGRFLLVRDGEDGRLEVRLPSKAGAWDDLAMRWSDTGSEWVPVGVGGGLFFAPDAADAPPLRATGEEVEITTDGKSVTYAGRLLCGAGAVSATLRFHLVGKSLVADIQAEGGLIQEVRFGATRGFENPRLVTLPYYSYDCGDSRPAVIVSGTAAAPLFFMAHIDWTQSNASAPFVGSLNRGGAFASNGGTRYLPKTDGTRNPCFERFVFTLSPTFEDVLPNIPNPASPWKHLAGTRVWSAREADGRDIRPAVTPWGRPDFEAGTPGAATFASAFYACGESLLLQKAARNGPVYSEGNCHFLYCGLTDGSYAQDPAYHFDENPWLVDFDLRRLHDLCGNFGMGAPDMFYTGGRAPEDPDEALDRFLAATVAFGHRGFLLAGRVGELRSTYLVQALAGLYTQAPVDTIEYIAASGETFETSAALANGAYLRSQLVAHYANGCVTVVNGNRRERLRAEVDGTALDLPPNGYWGRSSNGTVRVFSGDVNGRRADLAVSPDYTYIDGRGSYVSFPEGASTGLAVCRTLTNGVAEVLLHNAAEAGFPFAITEAVALDNDHQVLGPAEVRVDRGLSYVQSVSGAAAYRIRTATPGEPCDHQ